MDNQDNRDLLLRYKTVGCRDPKNPYKTLKSSHPYCKWLIKRTELNSQIDFTNRPTQSEKLYKRLELLEKKIDDYKVK